MSNITLNIPKLGNRFYDYRQDCWGDSFNWDFARNLDQVIKLAIHHSVTPQVHDWKKETDYIGELHKARGWAGIGYHFVIGSDGVVAYVGDIGLGRANIANNNEKIIGICLVGDFTKQLPTDIQINSAHDLCDFFINEYPNLKNINTWDDVIGHKDAIMWAGSEPTQCPGTSWPNDMKERIKNNIVYSPAPTPPPSPTPPVPPTSEPVPTPPAPPAVNYEDLYNKTLLLIQQAKDILWGKGFWWTKLNNLKKLFPQK